MVKIIKSNKVYDRWKIPRTVGVPLMVDHIVFPMTTGADIFNVYVPKDERWLLYSGDVQNGSGATINISMFFLDASKTQMGYLFGADYANGAHATFPVYHTSNSVYKGEAYPMVLFEDQGLRITFASNAGKSGNSYIYLNILRFKVNKI